MRKFTKVWCELNRGTWIKTVSMFLCVILIVEGLWFSCEGVVVAKQEAAYSDADGTVGMDGTCVEPEVRYDFCEIGYSQYVNQEVNPQVYARTYLSKAAEILERSGTSVSEDSITYDPYISNPSALTAVRNQGNTDTCWAFATTAAAEMAAIRQGLSDSSQWYSPYHMAYFMYRRVTDPLGGTAGDSNIVVSEKKPDFLMGGGNVFMSLFYLSSWGGLVKEENAPFDTLMSQGKNLDAAKGYDADVLLKNGYMLSTGDKQIQDFKQAIVEYGGVAIQLRASDEYKNNSTGAYYCNLTGSNHAVVIVGWDDGYSRENFKESCRPTCDGAWIIKNSYGSSQGREGYNYLSYEDQSIAYPIAIELMETGKYEHNYHYDGSLAVTDSSVVEVESGGQVANVFQAHASSGGYDESLEAVSIALKSTDVHYKISIYKNLTTDESGVVNPSSGKLMLTQEGKTGRAGVYTIPLEEPICLSAQDTFSVVFTLESENGQVIETWMEKNYDYTWVKGSANIQKNQSFRRLTARHSWFDLYYTNETKEERGLARIKAFTNTLSTISAKDIGQFQITVSMNRFVADGTAKCPEVSVQKGEELLIQGLEYEVEYQNNEAVGEGQIVITGIGPYTGRVIIPLYLYTYEQDQCPEHNFGDTKCILCGYPLKEQVLSGTQTYTKEYLEDAFVLDVFGNTTELSFQSDNEMVARVDESGLVTIHGIGTANIIVTAKANEEYQKAELTVQIQVQKAQITEVHLLENEFYYNGIPQKPALAVKNKEGQVLTEGVDYNVQYSNHNEIGTATILITGIGNYEGILKQTFTIKKMPEDLCSHTFYMGSCKYCGYEKKMQEISGTLIYEKRYTDQGFFLDAKAKGNSPLSYSSDDPSVVTVDEKGYVTIQGTGIAYIYVKAKETNLYYGDTQQILVEILPGKAKINVAASTIEKTYGLKNFTIKATTNSDSKISYKSSNKKIATISSKGKVTIKGYGKVTFTMRTEETDFYEEASKKVTMTVVPKKGVLSKLKAKGGKAVSLTWKKDKSVDGYQIQYSTSKNFKKSVKTKKIKSYKTTTITLKMQKKKTYYFRIRSYKKVGKKTYYGSYSTVKKIRVK